MGQLFTTIVRLNRCWTKPNLLPTMY